jgi:pyruvate kinase
VVARGDLGVECAPEDVPILQKLIIDECRQQGKPVVVATQMMESMIDSPTPTRAEASDAATAIYDGADAIMLSAESAAGKYPEESVLMRQIARNVGAKCITTFTVGGNTARLASKKRPEQPILAISPLMQTCRALSMSWGVYPEYCPEEDLNTDNFRDMLWTACKIGVKKGLVSDDKDLMIVTAGFPFGTPGAANIIRVIPAAGPTFWDADM